MNEISDKFKRQIEILGIAIKNSESFGTDDLSQIYGVERLTIKRDLQELRKHGIDIQKGVTIEDPPELKKLVLTFARGTLSNY